MKRFKNYGLWLSVFSLVGIVFKDHLPSDYQDISTLVLSILVSAGIISNPTRGRGYLDK